MTFHMYCEQRGAETTDCIGFWQGEAYLFTYAGDKVAYKSRVHYCPWCGEHLVMQDAEYAGEDLRGGRL